MKTWQHWLSPALILGLLSLAPTARAQSGAAMPTGTETAATTAPMPDAGRQGEFDRELLSVEEEVNSLKERVFRSKATLQLLAEIVAQGTGSGSRARITHVNELGRAYRVKSLSYYVDGQARFTRSPTEGGTSDLDEVVVFDGPLSPGSHKIAVTMQLQGSGGVFNYVDAIDFTLQSNATIDVEEGAECLVRVEADERGGMTRSFTERPDISFDVRCNRIMEAPGGQ